MTTAQRKKLDSLVAKLRATEITKGKATDNIEAHSAGTLSLSEIAASAAGSAVTKKREPRAKALRSALAKASKDHDKISAAATGACSAAGLNMTETMAVLFPEQ